MKHDEISPNEKKWLKWLIIVVGFEILSLIGFTVYKIRPIPATPTPFEIVEPCLMRANARTWIDLNRNGVIDPGEPPLGAVNLKIEGFGESWHDGGKGVTDWNGEVSLEGLTFACTGLDVIPSVPSGYELTTPPRLKIDYSNLDRVLIFGFAYLPGVPTVTPRAMEPVCTHYKLAEAKGSELNALAISPNGTVWVAGTGIYELPPGSTEWLDSNKLNAPTGSSINSITVENDNSVWFTRNEGTLHFDGTNWIVYSPPRVSSENHVRSFSPDNQLLWFAIDHSVFMLNREANMWREFTTKDGLISGYTLGVGTSADGSVWVSTDDGVSRAIWPSRPNGTPVWQNDSSHYNASATRIVPGPNDTVWFGGLFWPISFDLKTSQWKSLDDPLNNTALKTATAFAFAHDSSLWLGSGIDNEIFHLVNGTANDPNSWRSYDSRDGLPPDVNGNDWVQAIAISPDGAVWIATHFQATRCVFPER
jgi:ligand-binding sensor domain-containing protein